MPADCSLGPDDVRAQFNNFAEGQVPTTPGAARPNHAVPYIPQTPLGAPHLRSPSKPTHVQTMRHTHDRPHKHRNTAFSAELTMDRGEKTISAELRFADPVSDIAVFGKPDDQVLYEKAWLGTVRGLLGFLEAPAKLLATSLKS